MKTDNIPDSGNLSDKATVLGTILNSGQGHSIVHFSIEFSPPGPVGSVS